MRVLAIDPGYGRCGAAVLERIGGKDTLLFSQCIETSADDEFSVRLARILDHIERCIRDFAPTAVALERLYFTKNQKTAMRVAEARGAIIGAAARAGLPTFEYGPSEVKAATTGDGRADKESIVRMIRLLFPAVPRAALDDEYDAIAVGVTHLAVYKVHAAKSLQSRAN